MGISKNLKKIRETKGYTKTELAKISGLTARTIENIEYARHINPSLKTLQRIAKALDITVNDLIEER